MKNLLSKWNSRKLWAGVAAVVIGAAFPQLLPLIKLIAPTYIGVQGVVDSTEKLSELIGWFKAAKAAQDQTGK